MVRYTLKSLQQMLSEKVSERAKKDLSGAIEYFAQTVTIFCYHQLEIQKMSNF